MLLQGRSPYFLIAPLSALINGSLMPSVIGDRPSHLICLRQSSWNLFEIQRKVLAMNHVDLTTTDSNTGGAATSHPMNCLARLVSAVLLLGQASCLTGCGGAPSVTIAGAYFPAWLLCAVIAVVVAIFIRVLMFATRLADYIPCHLAVCCSLGAIVALILWNLWVAH